MEGVYRDERIKKEDIPASVLFAPGYSQISEGFTSANMNLAELCRLCLHANNKKTFPLVTTNDRQLSDKLSTFTSIQVEIDDDLPKCVCELCKSLIVKCYDFILQCEKSNKLLESLLHGTVKQETYNTNLIPIIKTKDNPLIVKNEEVITDFKQEVEYLENLSDENEVLHIVQNEEVIMKLHDEHQFKSRKSTKQKTKKLGNKKKLCPFSCGEKTQTASQMKEHIKTKHTQTGLSYPCGQCKEAFVSEQDLDIHAAVHALKGPWQCNQCFKEFQERNKLRRHIQWHMGQKRYSCERCSKCFVELSALKRHMRVHTGETAHKNFACEQCGKRFIDKRALQIHHTSHTGERPFSCDQCGKMFSCLRLLTSHALTHSDDKPYACQHCDKRFRHESTRNTHIRTHTGEKPYVCSACGKTFIQNSNLTLHMRTHTGEKPYSCVHCDKKFSSGSSLKLHIRCHTGEKPYSCEVCGKRFARKNLTTHMLRHTGERPFACQACNKTFTTKTAMLEHSRSHTGEKPFVCNECNQGFTTKSRLRNHLTNHTKKKFLTVSKVVSRGPALKKRKKEKVILQISRQPLNGEIVLEGDIKTDIVLVEDQSNYQAGRICLTSDGVEFLDNEGNVNLVTVDGESVSISSSTGSIGGASVKLYQIDNGLLQIAEEEVTSEL